MRTRITLACTECKQRNYNTTKDKKTHPDRMETSKYCRFCNAQRNQIISQTDREVQVMGNSSSEEKTSKPKFFDGVKAEFKKVTWPDRELLLKQSAAVVGISIVLGGIIAVLDMILQYAVDFLVK